MDAFDSHSPPISQPLDPVAKRIIAKAKRRQQTLKQKHGGPGSPGKKATQAEVGIRIATVAKLIARRLSTNRVRGFIIAEFNLSRRMANTYIARARQYLIAQSKKSCDSFVSEAVGFYEEILRDPNSKLADRMEAQAALRQMLGLDQPMKIAPTTPDGESPYVPAVFLTNLPIEQLAALRALHLRISAAQTSDRDVGS